VLLIGGGRSGRKKAREVGEGEFGQSLTKGGKEEIAQKTKSNKGKQGESEQRESTRREGKHASRPKSGIALRRGAYGVNEPITLTTSVMCRS